MAATTVSLKAFRISREQANDELRPASRNQSNASSRLQLIETIKNNVMAWTKWKAATVAAKTVRED